MANQRRPPRTGATSQTTQGRVCIRLGCGALLASYNRGKVCTHHRRDYDPRTDSAWPDKLKDYLAESVGRTAHPTAHFGIVPEAHSAIWRGICAARSEGWTIASTVGRDSYRVLGQPPSVTRDTVRDDSGERPPTNGETPE